MYVLEGGSSTLDNVIGVVPKLFELAGTCFTSALENPILLLFFAASMVGLGFGIFSKMKRAVRK